MTKKHTVEPSEVIEGHKPTIEEWNATQRSTRCGVCSLPQEIRDMVDQALRNGIGSVRITKYLADVQKVVISEPRVAHHRKAQHHLAEGTEAA